MSQLLDADGLPIMKEGVEPPPPPKPDKAEPDWTQIPFPIELFQDKVAIRRHDREEFTDGGLILPKQAQRRPMTGLVVGTGPGLMRGDGTFVPMMVKVGDVCVFEQFRTMTPIYVEGFLYHICNGHDLLGKSRGDVKIRGADSRSGIEG